MSIQAKVGAFVMAGIIIFMAMVAALSGFQMHKETYRVQVSFKQVIGLNPSAAVCYAGVNVGSVASIVPTGDRVIVSMDINTDVKIPRQSQFSITSDGVMGQKFVNIQPMTDADMNDVIQPDETVNGAADTTIDSMMENVNKALVQVHTLLASMNDILGNAETKDALKDISLNMREVTANLNVMTKAMAGMAVNSQTDVEAMARNLNMMTASLMRSADQVEQLVTNFNGDGETGSNLKQAVANLTDTSARIDHMASSLEGVVTDPQVAEDLKETLHNVKGVSARANNMMDRLANIEVKPSVETMYSGGADNWATDMDVTLKEKNNFLRLGVNDIGDGNNIDAMAGTRNGMVGVHGGVIESKAGLGADLYVGDKVSLSVDAYDPNDLRVKSRLSYEFMPNTYLFTQVNDINDSDKRAAYVGVRHSF